MLPVRWRISFATPMALHHIVGPRAHCNPGCWIGTGSTSIHHILRIARRSTVRRGLRGGTQWQPAAAVGSRARHGVARDLWLVNTLSFGAERKKSLLSSGEIGVGHRGPQVRKPCVVAGLPAHLWRRPPFPPTRVQQVLVKHLPGLSASIQMPAAVLVLLAQLWEPEAVTFFAHAMGASPSKRRKLQGQHVADGLIRTAAPCHDTLHTIFKCCKSFPE